MVVVAVVAAAVVVVAMVVVVAAVVEVGVVLLVLLLLAVVLVMRSNVDVHVPTRRGRPRRPPSVLVEVKHLRLGGARSVCWDWCLLFGCMAQTAVGLCAKYVARPTVAPATSYLGGQ
jgi:hypothetical protein